MYFLIKAEQLHLLHLCVAPACRENMWEYVRNCQCSARGGGTWHYRTVSLNFITRHKQLSLMTTGKKILHFHWVSFSAESSQQEGQRGRDKDMEVLQLSHLKCWWCPSEPEYQTWARTVEDNRGRDTVTKQKAELKQQEFPHWVLFSPWI